MKRWPTALLGLLSALALLPLGSCSTTWDEYPHSLYAALRSETPQSIEAHHRLLEELYTAAERDGRKPRPGIAAEYAYYSWKIGKPEVAREALAREREFYPESEKFVTLLERFLPSVEVVTEEPDGADGR